MKPPTTNRAHTGLYTPDNTLWRVNRELLLGLGAGRALLLELAHPAVAAGVAQHSNFRRDPLGRLLRTVRVMHRLSFGPIEDAHAMARHTNRAHHSVRGELADGSQYHAADPDLSLWVFATLVDSILVTYEIFARAISNEDKAAYYEDSKRMAAMFGLTAQAMPATYADFASYMHSMLTGDTLQVTPQARDVLRGLFNHPLVGLWVRLGSFAGIGLLPESLRQQFGLRWGPGRQRLLNLLAATTRRARRLLPDPLCIHFSAWRIERRWRKIHET